MSRAHSASTGRERSRGRRATSFACTAAAALALGTGAGVAGSSAAEPRWQAAPVGGHHGLYLAWAGGRVWFVKQSGAGITAKSGRVTKSGVGAWVTATAAVTGGWTPVATLGDDLVLRVSIELDPTSSLRAMKLLPNGKLGRPRELDGAPPPTSSLGSPVVVLEDRPVQLVDLYRNEQQRAPDLGACCDLDGNAASYAAFVPHGSLAELGLDSRGRLWLAWSPPPIPTLRKRAGIVELDPATLRPRKAPMLIPGLTRFVGARSLRALVCSTVCRVVVQGGTASTYGNFAWAPGEQSATRLVPPTGTPGSASSVEYAADDGGRLAVAYWWNVSNAPRVGLAVGDARGNRLRPVSSVPWPQSLAGRPVGTRIGVGLFGPGGFVTLASYGSSGVRVAVLAYR